MKKAAIVIVSGRVQNVGFRYHTKGTALKHQIKGFVKNQYDGTVYIEAEGEETQLELFVMWCHQGPAWASVKQVHVQESQFVSYENFVIR
nr:acylphosphatase [Bacteroidota bacterium]